MPTSANTSRTGRSVLEAAVRQSVVHFADLRLTVRLLTAESEEANLPLVQIHLTANQAVGPHVAQWPGLTQQGHLAVAIAAPQVDQPATGPLLQVKLPVGGEGRPVRAGLDPRRPRLAQGRDVLLGMALQVGQVGVLEAGPDLGLPPAVVTLDHGLEAGLAWGHQHRHHAQAQAQAEDPPPGVGVTMRAVEDHVVVELGLARQADRTPVLNQRRDSPFGGYGRLDRPGGGQAPVQRNGVEHLDVWPVFDDQALDDVDAVQLGLASGDIRQIPAGGWGRAARPFLAVQGPTATEDAVDGPHRGNLGDPLVQEGLADGVRTEGTQVALGQIPSRLQHQILQGDLGAAGLVRRTRAVREVHPIQALAFGTLDPVGHRRHCYAELLGYRTQRLASTHGGYHGLTALGLTLCLLIRFPPVGSLLRLL